MSWSAAYGWITRANGSFDFLSRECVVGTALRVDRMYLGGQLAVGDWVTLDYIVTYTAVSFTNLALGTSR